jgi:hypothetical protein
MNCRYCGQLIIGDSVKTLAYWNQTTDICHAECKAIGERTEAFDCQTIDADCNDCKHFQRGNLIQNWLSDMADGKATKRLVNMGIFNGMCQRFNTPAKAFPKMSTGRSCFEHRRNIPRVVA